MPPRSKQVERDDSKINPQALLQELLQDNDFFDAMVDMIPTKLYVPGQSGDDYNPKYKRGQAKDSKEARRAKNKQAKRAKLDPSQSETTTQAQRRLDQEKRAGHLPVPVPVVLKSPPKKQQQQKEEVDPAKDAPPSSSHSRIETLRAKLHAKLAQERSKRPDPSAISKRAARQAEKKRRKDEAIARKKKSSDRQAKDNSKSTNFTIASKVIADPSQDLATVDFGLLSGLNSNSKTPYASKTNKSLANINKTKNLHKLIADAEAKREKLQALQQGSEEDKVKAQNMQWSDTIQVAAGTAVKDDPAKLKKELKRKVAKKAKSTKAWKARTQQTQQAMQERQKIRTHNLGQRTAGGSTGANLSKKRINQEQRPGFEGRKKKFLNGGGDAKGKGQ